MRNIYCNFSFRQLSGVLQSSTYLNLFNMKLLVLGLQLLGIALASNLSTYIPECGDNKIPNYKNVCISPIYIEGCQLYSSHKTCYKCKQGYQLKDELCQFKFFHQKLSNQIIGCVKYNDLKPKCQICANGFRAVQGRCVKGAKNCIQYDESGICQQCHRQYSLLNDECHHNQIIGCKREDQNHQCLQCHHPFHLENGRCDIKRCTQIYDFGCTSCECGYYLSSNRTCQKFKRGCLRYSRGNCTDCIWHFLMKGGQCVIDGCVDYNHQICQKCDQNYEKTNDGGCQFKNCYDWLDGQCLICHQGFTLQGKVCVPQDSLENACLK